MQESCSIPAGILQQQVVLLWFEILLDVDVMQLATLTAIWRRWRSRRVDRVNFRGSLRVKYFIESITTQEIHKQQ